MVACGKRAAASCAGGIGTHVVGLYAEVLQYFENRPSGDLVVPQIVLELLELVEDDDVAAACGVQLMALVEDLLDVGLASGGGDDLSGHALEPVEALLRHVLRQNRYAVAAQKRAVVGASTAVVSRAGPDGLLAGCIEVACDQGGGETGVRGADLVHSAGEPLADQGQDSGLRPGDRARDLDEVDPSVQSAFLLRFVVPRDPVEVDRVHIPKPDVLQALLHIIADEARIHHLAEGRKRYALLSATLHVLFDDVFMSLEIDQHIRSPPSERIRWKSPNCKQKNSGKRKTLDEKLENR